MSTKKTLKRISLVAVSALGFGLMTVAPANAARTNTEVAVDALTVTTPSVATSTGVLVSSTFSASFGANTAATNDANITVALTKPAGSTVTLSDANGADAAAEGKLITNTNASATLTSVTIGDAAGTDDLVIPVAAGVIDAATDTVIGTIQLRPDIPGTYTITLTGSTAASPSVANLVTASFTVTVTNSATFYVHRNSAVSGVTKCSQTLTSNASTTITSGGNCFTDTATDAGRGVWIPEDGLAGTIASVTNQTTATLSAASPAQAQVAAGFYTGVRASTGQFTANGINASSIEGLTLETNAAGLLNLRLPSTTGVTAAKARLLINGTQIGISDITAKTTDNNILVPFTAPVAAGTYAATVQVSLAGDFAAGTQITGFTLTVLAAAADTYGSTSVVVATPTTVDADGVIYASAAVSATATAAATFTVVQRDVNGTELTAAAKTKAAVYTLTGVGSLASTAGGTTATTYSAVAAGGATTQTVSLFGTGIAGTATITFSVNGVVVATKTVKMYGNVASITVTPVYTVAPDAGAEFGSLNAGSPAAAVTTKTSTVSAPSSTNDPSFAITHKDSAGNVVPVVPSTMTSSNNSVILSGITASFVDAGTGLYTQGFGVAHVTISSAAQSKSGDKADVTFAYTNSNGTTITATPVALTIGGALVKVTLTTDKSTYAPGEAMTLTFTGVDAAGNPAYDGQNAIYSLTSSKQMQNLPSSRALLGGKRSNSSLLPVFAPAVSGPVTLNFIENTASLTKYAVTFTVSDDAASASAAAAADAAAEAIDAANAATDAANLAAEAADAATVAAEEARDAADAATAAVEELATQVATLMAALKAQITTLANTVAKIAKKVKA